jgi:hypothetical protein
MSIVNRDVEMLRCRPNLLIFPIEGKREEIMRKSPKERENGVRNINPFELIEIFNPFLHELAPPLA